VVVICSCKKCPNWTVPCFTSGGYIFRAIFSRPNPTPSIFEIAPKCQNGKSVTSQLATFVNTGIFTSMAWKGPLQTDGVLIDGSPIVSGLADGYGFEREFRKA